MSEIDPSSVYQFDLLRGVMLVREWSDLMPESGTTVEFAERRWIVTQRNVPAEGGRYCFAAALLPEGVPA